MEQLNLFHNTTNVQGQTLRRNVKRAQGQTDKILDFFREHPGEAFTPCQVWQRVLPEAVITSVRRSISDLTKAGKLEKLNKKIIGWRGEPAHLWKLK